VLLLKCLNSRSLKQRGLIFGFKTYDQSNAGRLLSCGRKALAPIAATGLFPSVNLKHRALWRTDGSKQNTTNASSPQRTSRNQKQKSSMKPPSRLRTTEEPLVCLDPVKILKLVSLLLMIAWTVPLPSFAAPANDACSGAVQIPGAGPFPYLTSVLDISTATLAGDPPVPDFYTNRLSRSVWYRFTPNANGVYTISTCAGLTATTVSDTVLGLFTSVGGCSGPFVQVAFEDENCNSQAEISSTLLADTTYFIVAWKYFDGSPDDGDNNLQLSITGRVTPPNDRCTAATPLRLNVPAFGTTAGATDDYHINAPTVFGGVDQVPSTGPGRDVVYSFTAPATDNYSIRLWNADVTQDILLYVASSCPGGTLPANVTTVLAGSNRSRVSSAEEIFCLSLNAGQSILVFVDHVEPTDNGSSFTLEVTTCRTETEPNNSIETASPIACGIEGTIGGDGTSGDLDFYSLGSFPPDWRAFVLVDGEASHNSDLDLRLVTTNATLEFDDNNNDTLFADSSPNIAGTPLPGGPVYVLVNYNGPLEAEPYRIYAVVQPPFSTAQSETEPNNTIEEAETGSQNYYRGSIDSSGPTADEDVYAFNVDEGDLFFVSLDGDPLRNNTPLNARLELIDAFGNVLFTVNDGAFSSNTNQSPGTFSGRSPFSPAEGFVYRFTEEGTFYVRVSASPTAVGSVATGDYLLSISRNCRSGLGLGNTPPAFVGFGLKSPPVEGSPVELTGAALELDLGDAVHAVINWGDGSSNVLDLATGGELSLGLSHAYPVETTPLTPVVNYQITVNLRDNAGGTVSTQFMAAVANVAPRDIQIAATPGTIFTNQSLTLNGQFTDPGVGDAHTASINWGDGSAAQIVNLPAGILQFSANHTFTVAGNLTITATVSDDDQGSGNGTTTVLVRQTSTAARFLSITKLPGPSIRLRLQATAGGTYRVEKADVFGSWSEVGVRTVDATGSFEIDDTAPTASSRFYRAVVVQ